MLTPSDIADTPADLAGSARWIEALDRQATIIMAIFARAGFEPIAPPVIQPADVFLDVVGEGLRARTYVFTDPDGAELCLRPDLTIPACRLYLARQSEGAAQSPARFAYNGVVFRYQPTGGGAGTLLRPREFRQAGIESFAADNPAKAEAEILALSVESARAAGLRAFRLHLGDLGIFNALIEAIEMPERWRAQLRHYFWQPEAFRRLLGRLVDPSAAIPNRSGLTLSARDSEADAVGALEKHLDAQGLTISGTRTLEEIAEHLTGLEADRRTKPLSRAHAGLIESYLHITAPATEAAARVRALAAGAGIDISAALQAYDARLDLIAQEGIDLAQAQFSAGFGRQFEYYTGFVFEILSPILGDNASIGGGGRYDTMIRAISGTRDVPAVGVALHTERLLLAVRGGRP